MGTWSSPWESQEQANEFATRMRSLWIAKVTEVERPDFGQLLPGDRLSPAEDGSIQLVREGKVVEPIGTKPGYEWKAERLYELCGDDGLFDELDDKAERVREDFDVRDQVRRCIRGWFERVFSGRDEFTNSQIPLVNVVRKAVGLPPFTTPGLSPLDDEDARDWLDAFLEDPSVALIEEILAGVEASEFDPDACVAALAAAELIAAGKGKQAEALPSAAQSWASDHSEQLIGLAPRARSVCQRIPSLPGVREIKESEVEDWEAGVLALLERLR